jgi:hypothetical protein
MTFPCSVEVRNASCLFAFIRRCAYARDFVFERVHVLTRAKNTFMFVAVFLAGPHDQISLLHYKGNIGHCWNIFCAK